MERCQEGGSEVFREAAGAEVSLQIIYKLGVVGRLLLFLLGADAVDVRGFSGSGSNKRRLGEIRKRSASILKERFWDILDRQANFGRGSRERGGGKIGGAAA